MDKKTKQRRHKSLTDDELGEIRSSSGEAASSQAAPGEAASSETATGKPAPRSVSFDTEEGRAAQGMRADIGAGGGETVEMEGAVGASDANSGAGNGGGIPDAETGMTPKGEPATRGDEEEDRKKLFPEAQTRPKKRES